MEGINIGRKMEMGRKRVWDEKGGVEDGEGDK